MQDFTGEVKAFIARWDFLVVDDLYIQLLPGPVSVYKGMSKLILKENSKNAINGD